MAYCGLARFRASQGQLPWALGHDVSVASTAGFIALAGVAAGFGVIVLTCLKQAWAPRQAAGQTSLEDLLGAICEGAVRRVPPKATTVAMIIAGLLPLLWDAATGSEVMQRTTAPMAGRMLGAPQLSMCVVAAAHLLIERRRTIAPR